METLRAVNYWRACWRTCLELDRAACHMITSAQWQFGFFIKRSHCPLWLIERVGGVTPHSGGWSCFIYTFFGLGLLSPPLDTPPNTYREERKKTPWAVHCMRVPATCPSCAWAHLWNDEEKNGRIYYLILLYPVEAPCYYQYEAFGWTESTCSLQKRQHVHVQTCPPLPQPTGGRGAQRGIAL